jgi:hypothetical protein
MRLTLCMTCAAGVVGLLLSATTQDGAGALASLAAIGASVLMLGRAA